MNSAPRKRFATWFLAMHLICSGSVWSQYSGKPIRIDISQDNGRNDVLANGYQHWRIGSARTSQWKHANLTFTVEPGDSESSITTEWWKKGFDHPAAMASDGIVVSSKASARLRLRIEGFTPGKHSLATFHNYLKEQPAELIEWTTDASNQILRTKPSSQVLHDDDCASMWREFEVKEGDPVVFEWKTVSEPSRVLERNVVILNGLVIDDVDPRQQAKKPTPFDGDEHAIESPLLSWTPNPTAAKQCVYVGTNLEAVEQASIGSKEFALELAGDARSLALGELPPFKQLNPFAEYFWRVDALMAGESEPRVRGRTWRFCVRRLAFPGAEGYGRFARGGRGGRTLHVTNLNDSGPGSLRDAVDAAGPRTVVFDVGGTIELKSKLVIRHPYITIAGQTAPGDGICIRGFTFGCLGTHDVVIRYVRIRVGDEAKTTMDGTGFASTEHSIMDHCSISWSIDEAVSSRGAGNITLQRCIVAEALNVADHKKYQAGKGHSFAGSISGNVGSFHHNLVAHCAGRNWSLAGGLDKGGGFAGKLDIRNNVVYNWEHRTTDGGVKQLNFVANFYIPGPATRVFHLLKPDAGSYADPQQVFMMGNHMEGREYDSDNWRSDSAVLPKNWQPHNRLEFPFCPSWITEQSAELAYANVLEDVGANVPKLDSMDRRILEDVRMRTTTYRGSRTSLPGIIDSQSDVGGWPELSNGRVVLDTDRDGMSDEWEIANGLNPKSPHDAQRYLESTHNMTNLERYHTELTKGH